MSNTLLIPKIMLILPQNRSHLKRLIQIQLNIKIWSFFAQLSGFAISTVFITFLFLTISFAPFWAISLALLASFGLRIGIKALIKALK